MGSLIYSKKPDIEWLPKPAGLVRRFKKLDNTTVKLEHIYKAGGGEQKRKEGAKEWTK